MIVVDSSAVIAIMHDEPGAPALSARLAAEPATERVMSTANYVEAGAVLAGRSRDPKEAIADLDAFLIEAGIALSPLDDAMARVALEARVRFGRGFGAKASLNLCDCYAYALAKTLGAPLLFTGNDFTHTDVVAAL